MIAPRLLNIFKTFSPDEIKTFEKFLLSPFFNTAKIYVKFFNELKKFYPDFKSDNLTSEYIFERLYKGKPFSKQTIWNLSSGLEKLAEEFLIHSSLINKPHDRFNLIFEQLELRELGKHYNKKLHEMEKMMEKSKIDADYLHNLVNFEEFKMSYWQKIRGLPGRFYENEFNLAQIYTLEYLINIARIIESLNVDKTNYGFDKQCNMAEDFVRSINFKDVISISKENKYKYAELIEFYYNIIYCSLDREDEKHFFNAEKFLFENHDLFERTEKKNLATSIANYSVQKYQLGSSKYLRELFKINKFRLNQGIATFQNGKIGKSLFIQIVYCAASLKEIKWVENFIKDYTPLLFDEHQERMKNLAYAYIFFNTKRYSEVLSSLKKFEFSDVLEKMQIKNLIARTYFEMKEFEMLLFHIDATKHFLGTNKNISEYFKDVNGKFFNYLHSIVAAIEKNDMEKLNKLEESIRNENSVNNKVWLLEKLSEIKFD